MLSEKNDMMMCKKSYLQQILYTTADYLRHNAIQPLLSKRKKRCGAATLKIDAARSGRYFMTRTLIYLILKYHTIQKKYT